MIQVNNVTLKFGKKTLFEDVNVKFTSGNCYGIIGANGAGKSTFLKLISGELETTHGEIIISKGERVATLKQNHYEYDEFTVMDTVIMGNSKLYEVMKEKEKMYMQTEFTDEDGIKLGELEATFAELNGWKAESEAATLLTNLGIEEKFHYMLMKDVANNIKVKVKELLNDKKYSEALDSFASLRPSIDAMFDSVMVMDKDEAIKNNRLGLLKQIYDTMLSICDLSKIVYK